MNRRNFLKTMGCAAGSCVFPASLFAGKKPKQLTFEQIRALPVGSFVPCEICPQRRFNPDRCMGRKEGEGALVWKISDDTNAQERIPCVGRLRVPKDDKGRTNYPVHLVKYCHKPKYVASIGKLQKEGYYAPRLYGKANTKQAAIDSVLAQYRKQLKGP